MKRKKHSSGYFYLENSSYIEMQYSCRETDLGNVYDSTDIYFITEKGKVALKKYQLSQIKDLREKRKDLILRVFPIIISTIALLKSFQHEIISLWKLLMQLLK